MTDNNLKRKRRKEENENNGNNEIDPVIQIQFSQLKAIFETNNINMNPEIEKNLLQFEKKQNKPES